MNISFFYFLISFFLGVQWADSKEILAVFPHFGISHFYMYEPYVQKLAERGHNVTVLAWFKIKNPHKNLNVINFENEMPQVKLDLAEYEAMSKFFPSLAENHVLNKWGQDSCVLGLSDPKVKDLISSKKHFDAVVVELFNTDCFAVFAHVFKAPLIAIFSSAPLPWHSSLLGNPDNPAYIPNSFTAFPSHMGFMDRVKNTLLTVFHKLYYKSYSQGPTDKIIKRHVGKGIPKIQDIVQNTSVFLVNSHHSVFQAKPNVPGFIEVGGIHIQPPKALPNDLEKFITNSKNGVVYFSLGTVTSGASLPAKKRDAILKTFAKLPVNVLWKWEDEEMPGKPDNVMIKKWVPQNDVLAHPNVKLFITHGGLMGTLEAVSHGVPMVMIPLFGDQFYNAASLAEKGVAVVVDYFSLNEFKFGKVVRTVLEDKTYAHNAKVASAIFKERPLSPMNNAIYWTEYVLKFKGALHLSSPAKKLSWYSEYLIDVFIFSIIGLVLMVIVLKKIVMAIMEMKKANEDANKKKK